MMIIFIRLIIETNCLRKELKELNEYDFIYLKIYARNNLIYHLHILSMVK